MGGFKVPQLGIGQMAVHPGLPHDYKSTLIPVNIIPEKERKSYKKGNKEQNPKNSSPV